MNTKAYNVTARQLTTAVKSVTSSGTDQVKFRAKLTVGKGDKAREIERTGVAQGAAAALLVGKLRKGTDIDLRVMFNRAPANDNGKGGEFLTVVALPRAKAA